MLLPALLSLLGPAAAFEITDASSDIGQTVEYPARSGTNGVVKLFTGRSVELRCGLAFHLGEQWTRCTWSHSFPGLPADLLPYDDNRNGFVMCSAHHENDNGQLCQDQGNLQMDDRYGSTGPAYNPWTAYNTDRLVHSVGEDYCGLTIMDPHANDTGIWTCHVNDNNPNGQTTTMRADVVLFVANKSTVAITNPDQSDPNLPSMIEVDLTSGRGTVDAECKAEFGLPPPHIVWYVNDPDNKIDDTLSSEDQDHCSSADMQQCGVSSSCRPCTVTSKLRINNLDHQMLSRYGVREDNAIFSLAIGCYPDQNDYFTEKQDWRTPAEVMVYVTSGSRAACAALSVLLALAGAVLL